MHRFFLTDPTPDQGCVQLEAEDARHALKVLRMRPGDPCELLGGGGRWQCRVDSVADGVTLRLLAPLPSTEPALRVTLFQGLPKGDKMELVVQKAVELGAAAIAPVIMSRSVARWDPADAPRKLTRWRKIAREACKQSGRCLEPEVLPALSLPALAEALAGFDAAIVPWEEEHSQSLPAFFQAQSGLRRVAVIIGPEGGMEENEISLLRRAGALPVTLGPRILRTETAGMAALAALLCLSGDMG